MKDSVRCFLISLTVLLFSSVFTDAQVRFVQITDPHLFDDTYPDDSRLADRSTFNSCIDEINQRFKSGGAYDFVVVTGDLGVEQLIKDTDKTDQTAVEETLRRGAADVASSLALSHVKRWLFVPGNNDVLSEIPENVVYYNRFIELLTEELKRRDSSFQIIDLCPRDASNAGKSPYSRSDVFTLRDYAFVGFNDATFKNSQAEEPAGSKVTGYRIDNNAAVQKVYVEQVEEILKRSDFKYAYIFYHVPEIDDAYFVSLKPDDKLLQFRLANQTLMGGPYQYSSWFVRNDVRAEWTRVVTNPRVMGLFAGHFHDNKRLSYEGFSWLLGSSYPTDGLAKLHVCPPLALKFQNGKAEQAIGFQEVYVAENGVVSARVIWSGASAWNPGAAGETALARQFELGQLYERGDRMKEAEAAYAKAAESSWPPLRAQAGDSLRKVLAKRPGFLNTYFWSPVSAGWQTGVTALGGLLPTVLVMLALIVLLSWPLGWVGKIRGRNKLRILPIVAAPDLIVGAGLEEILAMLHGRICSRFRKRTLVFGAPELPLLARSQSAEVPEMIEAALPGGIGKVINWLGRKTDRPRYSIGGAVVLHGGQKGVVFVAVQQSGRELRTWRKSGDEEELVQNEINLAFAALKFLVRHMNP